jgi:hypothetical protein
MVAEEGVAMPTVKVTDIAFTRLQWDEPVPEAFIKHATP